MDQNTQSIQDKIRSAAIARGIDPDVALRIANAESTFSNTAKNTKSSARGLFQIIDSTWKNFGGDPAKRDDVDENIRVGLNVIAGNRDSFLKRFDKEPSQEQLYNMHVLGTGDAFKVFNAKENEALKNIVPPKVIKANPYMGKMTVADFINFTQDKMAKKGVASGTTAEAKTEATVPMPQAPKETMRPSEKMTTPMNADMLAELGPSYQAALGAISLADSAEEDDDELLAEKYADRFGGQENEVMPSTLGDIKLTYASPFEEPQQEPVKLAFGGLPYAPTAMLNKGAVTDIKDAGKAVDDYNARVKNYQSSFISDAQGPILYKLGRGNYFPVNGGKALIGEDANKVYMPVGKTSGGIPLYYVRQGQYRDLAEPNATSVEKNQNTAAQGLTDAKAKQRRLQLTYDVMSDPESYNLSLPKVFAEGGEALPELGSSSARDMQDFLNSSVSGNKDVLQGMVGGQPIEGVDARLIGSYMQSLPPKFAKQFLLNLEIAKKAGVNLNKEGVANIYANIANGDTNYQIGYSPTQKSININRMSGDSGIGLNIGRDNVGLNYASRFATGGEADRANQPITTPDGYEITPSFADRMGANVSDFVVNMGTKAASLFPVDETKISAAHRLYLDTFGIKENRAPITKDYFNQEEMAALTDLVTRKGGKKGSITYNDYKTLIGDRLAKQYPLTSGRLDPYVSISKSLGQFNYEYDPKTGSYKILDEYDFNPKPIRGGISSESNFIGDYIGEEQASLMDKLRIYAGRKLPPGTGRQVDLSVPAPRKRAEGSPMYGEMIPDSGPITADTRAAMSNFQVPNAREAMDALKRIYGEGASNAESLVRGSVAAVPGTFGDIGQSFDIRGLRNLPTTEQLLKRFPQRMTQPTAETAGFEDVGTYMPPPIPPTVVSGTAKAMMKGLKESGPQVESIMRKIAPAAEPFYIVRPTGGEFATVKSMSDAPVSRFDSTLAKLFESRAEPQYASVNKFFDTKFRDYFKKQAGSVSDPVREGLISGKIKIPKDSPLEEMFPEALIKAARDGDITAMKLIEKQLDEATNIKSYKKSDTRDYASDALASDEMRSTILQQMKSNPDIIPDAMLLRLAKKNASNLSPEKAAQTVADIRAKLKANPELFSTVYEEKIMRMIPEKLTDVVTPEYLEKFPSLYGDLKNIFKDRKGIMALKGAAPVIDVESAPKLFGMTLTRIHELMQQLPAKELERMDVPTMLNKVIQLDKVSNEVAGYANQAEKLISAGKAVPEKIATYGTKPFTAADKQGFMWREITEPDAATIQGKLLGNSIGGYARPGSYGSLSKGRTALDSGEVKLFGLFDKNNQLMTNVEYVTNKAEKMKNSIPQFYGNGPGTGNVPPTNFAPQVEELIKKLNPDVIPTSIKQLLRDNGISFTK